MKNLSAADLRAIIEDIVSPTIEMHRGSRDIDEEEKALLPEREMSEDEITDFVLSNPLLDSDTAWHLADPGLLGFSANYAEASDEWLDEFRGKIESWAATNEWLGADIIYYHVDILFAPPQSETELWTPSKHSYPTSIYLAKSPSHLALFDKVLRKGGSLSDLNWREFELLIGELLEENGWTIEVMCGTKDGGIDVISIKGDPVLGSVKAIWQAKKYKQDNKVGLSTLREFSGVLDQERATKGIVVTSSTFTRGAINWIQKDKYRLSGKDGREMEQWIRRTLYAT